MATVPHDEVRVTVGVDTHEDVHVAVALDQLGRWLGELAFATTFVGYSRLVEWASQFGVIDRFGVEGTGSWGAGLSRWLRAEGLVVVEVDRPDRKKRRRGMSDTIDAEAAARAVLSTSNSGRGASKRSSSSSCSHLLLSPKAAACASSNRRCQRAHGLSPSGTHRPTSSFARSLAA